MHTRKSVFSTHFPSHNQVHDELDHGFALFGVAFGDEQRECDEGAIAQDFGTVHAVEDFVAGHVPQENECGDALVAIDKGMVLDEQIEERCGFQLYGRIKVLAVEGLVNLSERTFERGVFFNSEDAAVAELFLEHSDSVHGEFVCYGTFRFGVVASLGDFKLLVVVAVQRFKGCSKVADDVCNFKFFVFIHDVLLFVGERQEYRFSIRQL